MQKANTLPGVPSPAYRGHRGRSPPSPPHSLRTCATLVRTPPYDPGEDGYREGNHLIVPGVDTISKPYHFSRARTSEKEVHMGVLKRFEQRLEGLVNGTFAKVFKSEVQPVEIAGALQRECDNNATIWNRERTVVPNDFIVELGAGDFERLSPYAGQLGDELAAMVKEYANCLLYPSSPPLSLSSAALMQSRILSKKNT